MNSITEVGNVSQIISRCHNEQGLLGFEFTHNYNFSKQILLTLKMLIVMVFIIFLE